MGQIKGYPARRASEKVPKSRRGATAAAKLQVNDPESGVRNRKGACVCVCLPARSMK